MGQAGSSDRESVIPETVEALQSEICRHARVISEIASLSYDDFRSCINQLNELCKYCRDRNGKQLVFVVKKGTDSTLLWKGTVKIACLKVDPTTKKIEAHRLFNLSEFLKVFRSLQNQLLAAQQGSSNESSFLRTENGSNVGSVNPFNSTSETGNCSEPCSLGTGAGQVSDQRLLTATMLLEEIDNVTNTVINPNDCCICLERKPNVMLPCAHSYCVICIEQWNVNHKTCPICREAYESADDTWVISEVPGSHEINEAICSTLMDLTSASSSSKSTVGQNVDAT